MLLLTLKRMTPEDFIAAFRPGADPDSTADYEWNFRGVRERLRGLDDSQRFAVLFPIAIRRQGDALALDAACLLRELSPHCPLACEEAIRAMLLTWDVSLEEVPFYLAARFEPGHVRDIARKLMQEFPSEPEKGSLRSIAYWMDMYEAAYTEKNAANLPP